MLMRPTVLPEGGKREVLAYFGHHKCASSWIVRVLARISADIGLRHYLVTDQLAPQATGPLTGHSFMDYTPNSTFGRDELRERVSVVGADIVTCLMADRLQAEILRPARAFHVIRDPRDIIVSAYFSHRNSHPTDGLPHIQAHREALRDTSVEQGLFLEMEFSKTELLQIGDWDYSIESVLELRTEELTLYPYEGFLRICRHLDLLSEVEPVRAAEQMRVWTSRLVNRLSQRRLLRGLNRKMRATGEIVLGAVYAQRFEAQTGGRERGIENAASHYRKGVAGDWVNYFTGQHAEAFNAHFGDLLLRLGYEERSDWMARERSPA